MPLAPHIIWFESHTCCRAAESGLQQARMRADGARAGEVALQAQLGSLQAQLGEATGVVEAVRAERNKLQVRAVGWTSLGRGVVKRG